MNDYKDYYVYCFLDPRKPGKYLYDDLAFDFEPFYIGKGRAKRIRQHFTPYDLSANNLKTTKIKAIFNKNLKPIEQILFSNLTEAEALDKEIEIVKLIGRKDRNLGPLTNMTDAGDGVSGYDYTEEEKRQRSIKASGKGNGFYGKKHILSSTELLSRKVYQIDKDTDEVVKEYPSMSMAAKETNSREPHIRDCCKGSRNTHNGFKWKYVDDINTPSKKWKGGGTRRPILQLDFDTEEVIKEWNSISDAARHFDIRRQNIIKALSGYVKSSCGFKWKYKE